MSCSKCTINSGMRSSISFFFYFNCLPDDVLCKIPIKADDTDLKLSCGKPSDLSQQVEIAYQSYFEPTYMKLQYQKFQKMQFCIQLFIDIWEIILYLQVNPYRRKTENINGLLI